MACRHCNTPKGNRPRGLCFHCYRNTVIRELYEPQYTKHEANDTAEEIEALVAEQYANRPDWFDKEPAQYQAPTPAATLLRMVRLDRHRRCKTRKGA